MNLSEKLENRIKERSRELASEADQKAAVYAGELWGFLKADSEGFCCEGSLEDFKGAAAWLVSEFRDDLEVVNMVLLDGYRNEAAWELLFEGTEGRR